MSDSKSSNGVSGGIGVFGALGILFVALKLLGITEVATWSWLWVLAPFWVGLAVVAAVCALFGIIYALAAIFSK